MKDTLGRRKGIRISQVAMFMYYCKPLRTGGSIEIKIPKVGSGKYSTHILQKRKLPSYRDVAIHFNCSVRVVEKWGSYGYWYLKRKYFGLKAVGLLPSNLDWIYDQPDIHESIKSYYD